MGDMADHATDEGLASLEGERAPTPESPPPPEILPCPHCGSPAAMEHTGDPIVNVLCQADTSGMCHATGPLRYEEADAIAAWNEVAALRARAEAAEAALQEIRNVNASECDFDGYVFVVNETARVALQGGRP